MELLALLNLVSRPLLIIHLQDLAACYEAKRSFPGPSRLQFVFLAAAVTTGLTLHLLASF